MDVYAQIAERIIESQEAIIGPVAVEQAEQVPHLQLDWSHHTVKIEGNAVQVIDNLIGVYADLFGQISIEVSKEAAGKLLGQLTPNNLPEALK